MGVLVAVSYQQAVNCLSKELKYTNISCVALFSWKSMRVWEQSSRTMWLELLQ